MEGFAFSLHEQTKWSPGSWAQCSKWQQLHRSAAGTAELGARDGVLGVPKHSGRCSGGLRSRRVPAAAAARGITCLQSTEQKWSTLITVPLLLNVGSVWNDPPETRCFASQSHLSPHHRCHLHLPPQRTGSCPRNNLTSGLQPGLLDAPRHPSAALSKATGQATKWVRYEHSQHDRTRVSSWDVQHQTENRY